MASDNRLLDDVARVANGALGAFAGIRGEVESLLRHRLDRLANDLKVVTQEEFDVLRAMAAKAREEQEAMAARLAVVEARLAALETVPAKAAPAKAAPAPKAAAAKPVAAAVRRPRVASTRARPTPPKTPKA